MTAPAPPLVLMVDDNVCDVELTREAFTEMPVPVRFDSVRDGYEALAYLRHEGPHATSERPDLILLDLNMPRMNGRETLAALKGDPHLADIPVVVLTTSESEHDVLDCYRKHAAAFVTKPVTVDELIEKLRAVCRMWLDGGVAALPRRRTR